MFSARFRRLFPGVLTLALVLGLSTISSAKEKDKDKDKKSDDTQAQSDQQENPDQDPLKRPISKEQQKKNARALRKELGGYRKWLEQDVAYIISDEERKAFMLLSNDEERDNFIEAFWQRRDPTPDTIENEFKEEHYRRIAWANTVIVDAQGRTDYVVATGIDVTELKQVQEQLRKTERIAELGTLASGMAHEIGTPMNVILGRAEYLMDRVKDEPVKKGLKTIIAMSPTQGTGPILIVDDDPQALELHKALVEGGLPGYPIRLAENGESALALMEQEVPALVLLDLVMPNLSGTDVLDQMRAHPRLRHVPVLILSNKVLSLDDVKRIESHTRVTLQSKGIWSDEETIAALNRALFGTDLLPVQTSGLVKQAIVYLQQNYTRPISRWEVADAVGVSEDYLSRVFNRELNIDPC